MRLIVLKIVCAVVRAILTAGLVFIGAFSTGQIDKVTVIIAAAAAITVLFTNLLNFLNKEESEIIENFQLKGGFFNII